MIRYYELQLWLQVRCDCSCAHSRSLPEFYRSWTLNLYAIDV